MITKVVDVNDVQVGELVSVLDSTVALVIVTVGGNEYRAYVDAAGFIEFENRDVYFNSASCSGNLAYLAYPISPNTFLLNLPPLTWALPGKTLYIPDPEGEPEIINFSNKSYSYGIFCNAIGEDDDPRLVIPAIAVADLDSIYEAPFHLE